MDQPIHSPICASEPVAHLNVQSKERKLPVFCPHCGMQIDFDKGICGNRLIDAILLQAERMGAELVCQKCKTRFVFQRVSGLTDTLWRYGKVKERLSDLP